MKRTLLALATAAATIATAAPVLAQPYGAPVPPPGMRDHGMRDAGGGYGYGGDFYRGAPQTSWERMQWLEQRIERSEARGAVNPREAMRARRELNRTRSYIQNARARYGQLRPQDRTYVDARLDYVRNLIHWQRNNWR